MTGSTHPKSTRVDLLDDVVRAVSDASELYASLTPSIDFALEAAPLLNPTWLKSHAPVLSSAVLQHSTAAQNGHGPAGRLATILPELIAQADVPVLREIDRVQSRIAAALSADGADASPEPETPLYSLAKAARLQSVQVTPGSARRIALDISDLRLDAGARVSREFIGAEPDLITACELAARHLGEHLPEVPFPLVRSALHVHTAAMWLWLLYLICPGSDL